MSPQKQDKQEEKPATERQFGLIKALMDEIQCKALPERFELDKLDRDTASECVHYLKEVKVRDQALRAANQRKSGLDKIAFGLVYKLLWREMARTSMAVKPSREKFIDAVIGEYELFKDAQLACRVHVDDGGQK